MGMYICNLGALLICWIFVGLWHGFGLNYLNKTLNFMDLIGAKDYQIVEYYVLVLENSKYQTINDINNFQIGIYDNSSDYTKAWDELDNINIVTM